MTLIPLTSTLLPRGKIRHGFFTRQGGVSAGIYASLNCGPGSSDDPAAVRENRKRVALHLAGRNAPVCTLYQIHSNRAVLVAGPWPLGQSPEADAMVTTVPGIVLGVLAADCAPILLADDKAGVIAAAHAGWRGALKGVVEAAVAAMAAQGATPKNIKAAIGPCISQKSYEVGPDLRDAFLTRDRAFAGFFAPGNEGKFQFNLTDFAASRLVAAGVTCVERLGADTVGDEARFFSFRRATRRAEADYGRQISAIFLSP